MEREKFDLDTLTQPISWEEMEWKIQALKKEGGTMTIVPYITSRCVQERFDTQFGWDNWDTEIQEVSGGILCKLTVTLPDGRQVSKMDGAPRSEIEPLKGGISDAFKRVAVQYGMGRDLYRFPRVLVTQTPAGTKFIPDWLLGELKTLTDTIAGGHSVRDPYFVKWKEDGKTTGAAPAATKAPAPAKAEPAKAPAPTVYTIEQFERMVARVDSAEKAEKTRMLIKSAAYLDRAGQVDLFNKLVDSAKRMDVDWTGKEFKEATTVKPLNKAA